MDAPFNTAGGRFPTAISAIPPTINDFTLPSHFETRFQFFIQSKYHKSQQPKQRLPLICHTKENLKQIQDLIQSVHQQSIVLKENLNQMTDADFAQASQNILEQQQIITDLIKTINKSNYLARVRRALDKRRKKRDRKRQIATTKSSNKPTQSPKSPISIDQTTYSSSPATPKHIPTNSITHHKSNRAISYVSLIEQLKELHRIRSQQAGKTENTPEVLNHLYTLWSDAVAHNIIAQEQQQRNLNTDSNCPNPEQMWQRILFGEAKQRNSLHIDTEPGMQQLIEIRRCWDSFLVNDDNEFGSSIPMGFVLPIVEEPPSGDAVGVFGDGVN